jgi:hypothetical protein
MSDNKITFGKPKTPGQQPAYVPEQTPENIDNVRVYDFGKKYSVLDFKFQELKQGAVYTVGFDITPGQGSFIFKTTFYNVYGQEVSTTSVEVPEGTPIESVELDYENKELVIHTVGGEDIIADFSEMIDKIEALETEVQNINNTIFMDDVITNNDNITLVEVGDVLSNNLDLGERGEQEDENLNLDVQKTIAFYNKQQIDERISNLIYEVSVGTEEQEPDFARTWFRPAETYEEEPIIQMSTEFTVLYNDGPEVSGGSFIESNIEKEPDISENEISRMSFEENEQDIGFSDNETSMTFEENEQSIGFSENEATTTFQENEQSVGLSDTETVESTENNIELNPGFSDNEIK